MISMVFIVLETGLYFVSLYTLKLLIDAAASQPVSRYHDQLLDYIIVAGTAGILYFVIKAFSAYFTEVQAIHIAEHLNDRIHDQTTSLNLSFYEDPPSLDILKRAKDAGTHRPSQVITSLFDILKNTLTFLALGSVLLTINWVLVPLLILFVSPTLLTRIHFSDVYNTWRIRKTPLERQSDYYGSLLTTEQAAKELRSYRLGQHLKSAYFGIRLSLLGEKLSIIRQRTFYEVAGTTLAGIGFFLCIGYIILGQGKGTVEAGSITIFLVAFPQSFSILQNLTAGISTLYQNNIYIRSIFELIALKPTLPEASVPLPVPGGKAFHLELKHVGFSYPYGQIKSLDDITMSMQAGQLIAVVGENGAGKSSLIKLICRLYDPDEGQILLNGTDIREFILSDYQTQTGVVFQDFTRYQMTVKDNIRLGNVHHPFCEARMRDASRQAGAEGFIRGLPEGFESMLGKQFDAGRELSLGQWQKLAIARCLYSNARLLIFDEATSSLDARSEQAFFRSLKGNLGERCALVISHRQSVITHADYIYVLSQGKIVQSGTHKQLMTIGGEYTRLFGAQNNTESILL
jgi:ATP-binding cassette subfamily B protein